ncbi:MAG: hypothetical protein FJ217_10565 [Ignavibacteria bacterium]|nr:hypothetical protein [Ignavibacteria bacterium]
MIEPHRLFEILDRIKRASVGVVGDFCLDAYWELDSSAPELSVETGKPTHAVARQRYSLGGAGNVLSNVVSLGVRKVLAFGVRNEDLFGRELLTQLRSLNVDTTGMVLQPCDWDTPVYAKPYLDAEEQNRLDFGRYNTLSPETERQLLDSLKRHTGTLDALIINQQLPQGIFSPAVVNCLNQLGQQYSSEVFVLDSRDRSLDFHRMTYKINASEAARLAGKSVETNEAVTSDELRQYATALFSRFEKTVFITRSSFGVFVFDGKRSDELPAVKIAEPIDSVGAGDTAVAAIACALAAGATPREAGLLANLAAAVTVRKLRQTGTATPQEILDLAATSNIGR